MSEDIYADFKAAYIRRVVLLVFLDYLSVLGSFFVGLWLRFDFHFDEIADHYRVGYL